MFNLLSFLSQGLQNTILVKNNSGLSYNGPYIQVDEEIEIDRWYLGDFVSAEYTLSADLDQQNKEITKCLITATIDEANISIYGKSYTNKSLINYRVIVNDSYVSLLATPAFPKAAGAKIIFTKQMFHNQTPLSI